MAEEEQRARLLAQENARLVDELARLRQHSQQQQEQQQQQGLELPKLTLPASALRLRRPAADSPPPAAQPAAESAALKSPASQEPQPLPQLRLRAVPRAPVVLTTTSDDNAHPSHHAATATAAADNIDDNDSHPRSTCTSPGSVCSDSGYFRDPTDSCELPGVFGLTHGPSSGDAGDAAFASSCSLGGGGGDGAHGYVLEAGSYPTPLLGRSMAGSGSACASFGAEGASAWAPGLAGRVGGSGGSGASPLPDGVCMEDVTAWLQSKVVAVQELAAARAVVKSAAACSAAAGAAMPGLLAGPAMIAAGGTSSPHASVCSPHASVCSPHAGAAAASAGAGGAVAFDTLRPPGLPPLRKARSKGWLDPMQQQHAPMQPHLGANAGLLEALGAAAAHATAGLPLKVQITRDPSLGSSLDRLSCGTPMRVAGSGSFRPGMPGVPPSPATSRASPRIVGFDCSTPTGSSLRSPSWRQHAAEGGAAAAAAAAAAASGADACCATGSNGSTPRRQPPSPGLLHMVLRGGAPGACTPRSNGVATANNGGPGSASGTPVALRRNASAPGAPGAQQHGVAGPGLAPLAISGATATAAAAAAVAAAATAAPAAMLQRGPGGSSQANSSGGRSWAGNPHAAAPARTPRSPSPEPTTTPVNHPISASKRSNSSSSGSDSSRPNTAELAAPAAANPAAPASTPTAGATRQPPAAAPTSPAPATPQVTPPAQSLAFGSETPVSATAPDSGRDLWERRRALAREWDRAQDDADASAAANKAADAAANPAACSTPAAAAAAGEVAEQLQGLGLGGAAAAGEATPTAASVAQRFERPGSNANLATPPPVELDGVRRVSSVEGQQQPLVLARIESELQEVLTASGRRAAPYVPVRGMTR